MPTTYVTDAKGRITIDKDPDAVLDYSFDWTDWLTLAGDTIATASPVVGGVALDPTHSVTIVGNLVTIWVQGGDPLATDKAFLTCRIKTAGNRTDDRTIYFNLKNR